MSSHKKRWFVLVFFIIASTVAEFTDQPVVFEDTTVDGFPTKIANLVLGYSTSAAAYIPLGDGTQRVIVVTLYGPETTAEELKPLFASILSTVKIKG